MFNLFSTRTINMTNYSFISSFFISSNVLAAVLQNNLNVPFLSGNVSL